MKNEPMRPTQFVLVMMQEVVDENSEKQSVQELIDEYTSLFARYTAMRDTLVEITKLAYSSGSSSTVKVYDIAKAALGEGGQRR